MSTENGNELWKLRKKDGREKLFATPEILWNTACEYFQWVDENPFKEEKAMVTSDGANMGSSIEKAELSVKRPYTLHGLCIFIGCTTDYFRSFKSQERKDKADFITVIKEIEEVIYEQKFSGAAAGFFNANIIARDLGLKDTIDNNITDNRKQTADLFPEVLGKPEQE
jgi:hypothetical protein